MYYFHFPFDCPPRAISIVHTLTGTRWQCWAHDCGEERCDVFSSGRDRKKSPMNIWGHLHRLWTKQWKFHRNVHSGLDLPSYMKIMWSALPHSVKISSQRVCVSFCFLNHLFLFLLRSSIHILSLLYLSNWRSHLCNDSAQEASNFQETDHTNNHLRFDCTSFVSLSWSENFPSNSPGETYYLALLWTSKVRFRRVNI
jgi:hypothetical protein